MKKLFLRLSLGLLLVTLLAAGGFVALLLHPGWAYPQESRLGELRIHHTKELAPEWEGVVAASELLVHQSALYDPDFPLQICLDDGSWFPRIWERLRGSAFGYGYAYVVVLGKPADPLAQQAYWEERIWPLIPLLAHEMIHCYQYQAYGTATLSTPPWKQEGYAEYISKGNWPLESLRENVQLYQSTIQESSVQTWVKLPDGPGMSIRYFRDHLLVQYLMEEKGFSYAEILATDWAEEAVEAEMMDWALGEGK